MKRLVLVALAALASTGVAAKKEKPKPPVAEVPNYVLAAPPADQAQIVFVEPINKIQGMFPICILDVTGDKILEANVEAGKRYYVLLRFIYAQGFQLRPIRTSGTSPYRTTSPDFQKWMKETRWVEKTPEADLLCGESMAEAATVTAIANGVQSAMNNWQAKTAAEAAELTLNPEDVVAE